jgi:hypothetical protein
MSARKDISKKSSSEKIGNRQDSDLSDITHSSNVKYICPYCNSDTVFDTSAALRDHIYAQHLWNNCSGHARIPIPVCMSLGGMETQKQLSKRIDEMVKRGFVCDIELIDDILSDAYTRELADAGFELELDWQGIEELEDDYEIQLKFIADKKKALEDVIGRQVLGGRRSQSRRDKYTYDICDALGFKWYHIHTSLTYFPSYAASPYSAPGHNFALCPRPALYLWNPAGDVVPYQEALDGSEYF